MSSFPDRHPGFKSDCPFNTADTHPCGVLSINPRIPSRTHPPGHYWVVSRSLVPGAVSHFRAIGYEHIYFTPYTSRANWQKFNPSAILEAKDILPLPPSSPAPSAQLPTPSQHPPSSGAPSGFQTPFQTPSPSPTHSITSQLTPQTPFLPQQTQPSPPQNQQQQAQQYAPAPATAPSTDPMSVFTEFMKQHLQETATQHANQLAAYAQLAIQPKTSTKPVTTFPTYSGKRNDVPLFLARLTTYKADPFYKRVFDWSTTHPGFEEQSRVLRSDVLEHIPPSEQSLFVNDSRYDHDGFAMLQRLVSKLDPNTPESIMLTVLELIKLEQGASEDGAAFLSRLKGIENRLARCRINDILPLFALANLDRSRYNGLVDRFNRGDTDLVNCTLFSLETLMEGEELRRQAMGDVPLPPAGAGASRGTSDRGARPPVPTPTPAGPPTTPPPSSSTYPPINGIEWKLVRKVVQDKRQCVVCHNTDDFHWKDSCPCLASEGLVIVKDDAAAAAVIERHNTHRPPRTGRVVGRGPGRGGRGGRGGRNFPPPPPPPPAADAAAGARRASSNERTHQQPPAPPASAPPTSAPSPAPPPANTPAPSQNSNYYDEMASSSDDDASFDHSFGNTVDSSATSLTGSNTNSKPSSARYAFASHINSRSLPSGKFSTNRVTSKWQRKLANRREKRHSSARPAHSCSPSISSDGTSTMSSDISDLAQSHLSSNTACIFTTVAGEKEACADSGATDVMLHEYEAFVSYRRCVNRWVTLGDDTKIQILGEGTAKFSLNGKVILVRNALHVPNLRAPLYSLLKHKNMPGCGTLSMFGVGSFILFPSFQLQIDDSVDSIISYKSIGHGPSGPIDYAEPRTSARNASVPHIIPPDDSVPPSTSLPPTSVPTTKTSSTIVPDDQSVQTTSTASLTDDDSSVSETIPDISAPTSPPPPSVTIIDDKDLSTKPISKSTLLKLHTDPEDLPDIRPCDTPAPCENRTVFDTLKLHKIFGCRRFRNQQHVTDASSNATLIHTGALPATLGAFTTIPNPPSGKPLRKRRKFLDKVHMDIIFGDCVGLGGFRYAILLVDVATRYSWMYGIKTLTSYQIIATFEAFRADAGKLPKKFHSDFDRKLIGGKALKWILENKSKIIAAPAGRQSSNGLAERTWKTIIQMARAYITEKQVGREFWYFAIQHAAMMLNNVPGRLGRKLTTPFELVHNQKPDSKTWFELFSVGYFNHSTDNAESRSKSQAQTLDGIAVARDDKTNTITFYNPLTKSYYRPPAFKLDEGRLPVTNFPKSLRFDGGLTCGLLRNKTDPTTEPFPPGTRVTTTQGDTSIRGTIQNVPFDESIVLSSASSPTSKPFAYTILLDDGTTIDSTFEDLVKVGSTDQPPTDSSDISIFDGLPYFLHNNSKITMDHNGSFHKGYLQYDKATGFQFVVRRNSRSLKVDWCVPLPDFKQNWTTLVAEDIIIPDHKTISSFLRPSSSNNAPSANFVSAKNLLSPCPPSLLKALHPSNPDKKIWLDSYNEEKGGLEAHDVYERISKKTYLTMKRQGLIPDALPSMCVICIKPDKDGKPNRAKSRIVVLGNFEDRYYEKAKRYAPVLKYTSLRLLTAKAISAKRILQQGDCKNAFCNALLPPEERTVIRPPVGDPAYDKDEYWLLKKTLYGLRRSPRHWYDMINKILTKMGLQPSAHDPCLFTGIINSTDAPIERHEIFIGLYMDNFVYYSTDPAEEALFRTEIQKQIKVDFMGDADYFLGTAFEWARHDDGNLSVHLTQTAFTEHSAHRFGVDKMNREPNMTPYRSGYPIDSIPSPSKADPDLKRRTKVYQSIVGSINWLATCTRPDIAPALTFLASYSNAPHHQHYKAAIHALKYLYSTSEYGISFHSDSRNTIQAFSHFPHHHDKEAYTDATPPSPSECHQLTAYTDACWGSQVGNSVPVGTPLDLFKFRSLSGFLICLSGGPVAWKSIRQEQTAQSSCEAEILATNECIKELAAMKHCAEDLRISDAHNRTDVFNDNQACVDWAATMTNKGTKHINLRENKVRESHQDKTSRVRHIPGKINPSDIFTKEMKDAAHFRRLRDSFMVSKTAFRRYGHTVPSHVTDTLTSKYYSIRSHAAPMAQRASSLVASRLYSRVKFGCLGVKALRCDQSVSDDSLLNSSPDRGVLVGVESNVSHIAVTCP